MPVERSPGPLPLPPGAKKQLPGEGGRAAPQGCKRPADKSSRRAQERHRARHWLQPPAPRWAPLRLTGPRRRRDGCQQVCSAWPFPRVAPSEGLGWGNAQGSASRGAAVMPTASPLHPATPILRCVPAAPRTSQTGISRTHRSSKSLLPAPAGEAAAAKICLALPSTPVPSA